MLLCHRKLTPCESRFCCGFARRGFQKGNDTPFPHGLIPLLGLQELGLPPQVCPPCWIYWQGNIELCVLHSGVFLGMLTAGAGRNEGFIRRECLWGRRAQTRGSQGQPGSCSTHCRGFAGGEGAGGGAQGAHLPGWSGYLCLQ